jgi:hypothetical protein
MMSEEAHCQVQIILVRVVPMNNTIYYDLSISDDVRRQQLYNELTSPISMRLIGTTLIT